MKRKIFLVVLLILSLKSVGQDQKFGIELGYPILIDDNFIGSNYSSIIDLGLSYRIARTDLIDFGITLNSFILKSANDGSLSEFDITVVGIQPSLYGEFKIEALGSFHPLARVGYTILSFSDAFDLSTGQQLDSNDSRSGFNFGIGAVYGITNRLFVKIEYNFTKLNKDSEVFDSDFNTNVNILLVGLGYKI